MSAYYPNDLKGKKVIVGLSGGVDSSVTAALLKEQGADVFGLFMKNWEEKDPNGRCISSKEYEDVISVCEKLDIPYTSIDFVQEYQENVFNEFLEGYQKGHTPNPDILCNREIKFKVFFEQAMLMGADYLATGHYCQIGKTETGELCLLKGKDSNKDQTYFLGAIPGNVLDKVLFPIGHLDKSEVREIAERYQLSVSKKKDSTGICFIGERNFKPFLANYLKPKKGKFIELETGEIVGEHDGAQFYTIGQRKGLGLGGQGKPWFVTSKCIDKNVVYVVRGEDHPSLYTDHCFVSDLSWINFSATQSIKCEVKLRYRQKSIPCHVELDNQGGAKISYQPEKAVTIGQSAVFYQGDSCIGSGFISEIGPNQYETSSSL